MTHDHYQPMIHGHWEDDMKQGLTMFYSYRLPSFKMSIASLKPN